MVQLQRLLVALDRCPYLVGLVCRDTLCKPEVCLSIHFLFLGSLLVCQSAVLLQIVTHLSAVAMALAQGYPICQVVFYLEVGLLVFIFTLI